MSMALDPTSLDIFNFFNDHPGLIPGVTYDQIMQVMEARLTAILDASGMTFMELVEAVAVKYGYSVLLPLTLALKPDAFLQM